MTADDDIDAAILVTMAENNKLLAQLLEQVHLASTGLDGLRSRVEAIEDRHKRLDEGLLALKREYDEQRT